MTKKILILCLLGISVSNLISGQTLTANELITKSKCTSFDCYDDFMISKGFSFMMKKETEHFTFYNYSSDKKFIADNNSNITTPNISSFIVMADKTETRVNITTTSKTYYNTMKANFMQLGFNKTETKTLEENAVITVYTSKSYPGLTLQLQTKNLEKDGERWTNYQIEIQRKF